MARHGVPDFTYLYCSVCGRKMGKKPGVQVIIGLVCDKPICNYQEPVSANEQRDAYVVAGALGGVPVSQIAFSEGVSRQRIYQIIDSWKQGV